MNEPPGKKGSALLTFDAPFQYDTTLGVTTALHVYGPLFWNVQNIPGVSPEVGSVIYALQTFDVSPLNVYSVPLEAVYAVKLLPVTV